MSAPLRVGLIGLGTVGQAVLRVLARNGDEIARRCGRRVVVTHAAMRDPHRVRDCDLAGITVGTDPHAVAGADVDAVVELIGGISPARELILAALGRGRAVVTANKALLAEHGNQISQAARAAGAHLAYEAAVGGGIPIIKVLREGLAANSIDSLAGIINGTSNYILTQMAARGQSFADALADAQKLGYAEADPTFDVEGVDAAHKLAILASIAFGVPLNFAAVAREGIGQVTPQDIQLAQELGYCIKPLGLAKRSAEGIQMWVHPTLVPAAHPLARTDGALNAIRVHGDAVGQIVCAGRGAGGEATASAVIADLVDVARMQGAAPRHLVPDLGFQPGALRELPVVPAGNVASAYYLRLRVADEPGVLRAITSILAELDISIEAILQKEPREHEDATLAIITSEIADARARGALERMQALPFVRPGASRLRVEHFE
ncbi:MAG: homoserine dehydrogenase [Nevskia sp.]|nr:homoserine dehydrogenase [Nevskia sp.]